MGDRDEAWRQGCSTSLGTLQRLSTRAPSNVQTACLPAFSHGCCQASDSACSCCLSISQRVALRLPSCNAGTELQVCAPKLADTVAPATFYTSAATSGMVTGGNSC